MQVGLRDTEVGSRSFEEASAHFHESYEHMLVRAAQRKRYAGLSNQRRKQQTTGAAIVSLAQVAIGGKGVLSC